MPIVLRRSCAACAKAKHACDLRTPKCSRCTKRNCSCVYANQPLTSTGSQLRSFSPQISQESTSGPADSSPGLHHGHTPSDLSALSITIGARSFDPFDSYPPTSLPRLRVQGLIQLFLSKISFQYYPLDLTESNPFVTSWWPLALTDPALFHVSLQTASLDDEFQAQKGFRDSEILMRDSVSLVRRKVEDSSLAFQDATMDAVVTLAAIEASPLNTHRPITSLHVIKHGKGNQHVSKMHIEGIKRMVNVRGGLARIKYTSPLTARMVPWVSMLVMGSPQFEVQDDFGTGSGISVIPQWQGSLLKTCPELDLLNLDDLGIDFALKDILTRLRIIFCQSSEASVQNESAILSTTDLHDLTCFVLHKLLLLPSPIEFDTRISALRESIRYATSIYMFIIHGPTYYSHAAVLKALVLQLKFWLEFLIGTDCFHDPLSVWLLSVGMVASMGTSESTWFVSQATALSSLLCFQSWEDIKVRLQRVLWLEIRGAAMFRQLWEKVIDPNTSLPN